MGHGRTDNEELFSDNISRVSEPHLKTLLMLGLIETKKKQYQAFERQIEKARRAGQTRKMVFRQVHRDLPRPGERPGRSVCFASYHGHAAKARWGRRQRGAIALH